MFLRFCLWKARRHSLKMAALTICGYFYIEKPLREENDLYNKSNNETLFPVFMFKESIGVVLLSK